MREVPFEYWEWEEELEVLKVEHIALCKMPLRIRKKYLLIISAMIIVGIGLAISSVVFIIEIIIFRSQK